MNKQLASVCIVLSLVLSAPEAAANSSRSTPESKPAELRLTLDECISRVIAANPQVSAEVIIPQINEQSLRQAREQFMPVLAVGYFNQDQTTLGTWGVEGTKYRMKSDYYNFSFNQKLPTGATVFFDFINSMTNTERAYTIINPSYFSRLQLNISQPLLKGFGPAVNRLEVRRAGNRLDASKAALQSRLAGIVYEVEIAYWNLVDAIENLSVLESNLEQSRDILKRTKEAARIGTRSEIEVLSSETEVARWEDSVVTARLQVRRAEDELRKLMNMPPGKSNAEEKIVPVDRPAVIEAEAAVLEEAVAVAFRERPEVAMAEKDFESAAMDVSFYRNQTLPELNLNFSIWNPGQSGIRYIYENDDPFSGRVIGVVKGSRMESVRDVFSTWPKSWNIGLNLRLPAASFFSKAALEGAKLKSRQEALKLESLKQTVAFEVSDAIKEVENKRQKIISASAYRKLLEKRLQAEIERYNLGLAGSEWLFTYQNQLAQAKAGEIRATIDFRLATVRLEKAMGTLLKTRNIILSE